MNGMGQEAVMSFSVQTLLAPVADISTAQLQPE